MVVQFEKDGGAHDHERADFKNRGRAIRIGNARLLTLTALMFMATIAAVGNPLLKCRSSAKLSVLVA
jgi:hypothetical protein